MENDTQEITILVVDDEAELREELLDILTFEGFHAIDAANGTQGIEKARSESPDLIICDVGMPDMDGYQVLESLQKDSATATIPFIFLTAFADHANQRRGMSLGADDYMTKPFTKEDLLTAIQARRDKETRRKLQQLRVLSQRLIDYQEVERDTTAGYLQDEVLSLLSGLRLILNNEETQINAGRRASLDQAMQIVDNLTQRVQGFIHELRPLMLKHVGLAQAVSWLCQQVSNQYDIDVDLNHRDITGNIHYEVELAAFRILQEALLNAGKYAETDVINVKIWTESKMLFMEIIDYGIGFDLTQALNDPNTHGLLTIQERAASVGGYVLVQSLPKEGTSVSVGLPYEAITIPPLSLGSLSVSPLFSIDAAKKTPTSALPSETRATVIIAEENDLVRQGLRSILIGEGNYAVRAEVQTLRGLRNLVQDITADLLIMSHTLSESNIAAFLNEIKQLRPDMRVVILSNYPQSAYAHTCMVNGADGYILKQSGTRALLSALERIEHGIHIVDQNVQPEREERRTRADSEDEAYQSLTRRERETLFMVLEGMQNTDIAEKLVISPRTVETHRSNMMRKLGIRGQAALMRYAVNLGLISPETQS
ncbi:MAG: response regulator [Anaerolineae bacterium]|nr:response regulator [Anaerolineae bacterium]